MARLEVGPAAIDRGHGAAALHGSLDRLGYSFTVLGDADVGRTLRLARMLGVHALKAAPEGSAQLNLQIAGSWLGQSEPAGFAEPQVRGNAKLRNVRVFLRGGTEPVEIQSAEVQLSPDAVRIAKLSAKAAGTIWRGSMEMPRGCGTPESCFVRFLLNAEEISLHQVGEWANATSKNRAWYQVLGTTQATPSLLSRVRASGRITAERLVVQNVSASKLSANVTLDAGKVLVSAVDAEVLGGMHRGKWQADFSVKPAVCSGTGVLTGVSLVDVSKLMKDDWIEGTAHGSYELRGSCAPDFWQSSEGTLRVSIDGGILPRISLAEGSEMLKIRTFSAEARLRDGKIGVTDGKLDSPDGKYIVSGTVTLKREIDLKLTRVPASPGSPSYSLTGTLPEPRSAPMNETEQAGLKTPPGK